MTDADLYLQFERYIKEQNWTYDEAARNIGCAKSSLFNWKNGRPISVRARRAMQLLVTKPIPPAADHLTSYLLDEWRQLTGAEKAEIIALIESIKERKKSPEPAANPAAKLA